jgi:hypothetical protein
VSAALIAAGTLGDVVERVGAYGGLASMIGLGVLALLYFAQAREVKRLREWAGRAPERAAEIEQRVQADAQRRVSAQPQTPAGQVAATPAGTVPPASLPAAGLTGEAATRAAAAAIAAARAASPATGPPGQLARSAVPPPGSGAPGSPAVPAPSGGAAQAGGAATGGSAPASAPPAPAATAGSGNPAAANPPGQAARQPLTTMPRSAALTANGPSATASPPATPRDVAQSPLGTNGGGQETRESAAARPLPAPAFASRPTPAQRPSDDDDGRPSGRVFAIAAGVIGLLLVVGVLLVLVIGGADSPTKAPSTLGSAPTSQPAPTPPSTPTPAAAVVPSQITTRVLNGTTQAGLASSVAAKLEKAGFQKPETDTNVDQTLAQTMVYFSTGNQRAAAAVAKSIGVSSSAVRPADRNVTVPSPDARVVVIVGADLIK